MIDHADAGVRAGVRRSLNARDSAGASPLMRAAAQNQGEALAALVDAGADLDLADGEGQTALHQACEAGNVAAARLLLEAGADFKAVDKAGRTAGEVCEPRALRVIAEILRELRADAVPAASAAASSSSLPGARIATAVREREDGEWEEHTTR